MESQLNPNKLSLDKHIIIGYMYRQKRELKYKYLILITIQIGNPTYFITYINILLWSFSRTFLL